MRFSILHFLPALAAAADVQITNWVCTPTLDPSEPFDKKSVRAGDETGCAGWDLTEQDNGAWTGKWFRNPDSEDDTFNFGTSADGIQIFTAVDADLNWIYGTCEQSKGFDDCQTASVACSIAVKWDYYYQ